MLRKFLLCAVGSVVAVAMACSEGSDKGRRSNGTGSSGSGSTGGNGAGSGSGGSATTTGGAESTGGSETSGGATAVGGSMSSGGATPSGGSTAGGEGGQGSDITDAGLEDAPSDAPEPPVCLSSGDECGEDAGTCCEAYACRLGKCCVPTGVWSNCVTGADCCSGSCIQRQCTCVPRGYSCSGPGQCCSGFACVNGTCICPPDIRGCN